ncbi:hypothetical protein [Streptomyces sp. URMC 129]|uniref:hypothetical protein n=1 Tax=Streptomyces sp. URMC 129 TaxID=3423407 RepID=UPI003F1AE553
MAVSLFPPITGGAVPLDVEALGEAPAFVRTRGMSRWHRPRSGVRYPDGRTSYTVWCGQFVGGSTRAGRFLGADTPGGLPVCATCDGRAVGAGQVGGGPPGRALLFSPRHLAPPRICPGSRTALFAELPGGCVGQCLACGDAHPLRAMGGPYAPRTAITRHPPGAGLVGPCPFHAWRQVTARDGRAVCGCGRTLATGSTTPEET